MPVESLAMNELFQITLSCFSVAALGALSMARAPTLARLVGHGGALLGAISAFLFGIAGLAGGNMQLNVPDLLPIGGAAFGVDRLSAFFVVVVSLGAIPAALYSIGYTRKYTGKHSLWRLDLLLTFLSRR